MIDNQKTVLFEQMPVPKAVMKLAVPTILSSLVMVIYNLADTYFVGMMNNPVQNAAVTLAAPVLLAFNAVNNLFGVGSSSMMSRAHRIVSQGLEKFLNIVVLPCVQFFGDESGDLADGDSVIPISEA